MTPTLDPVHPGPVRDPIRHQLTAQLVGFAFWAAIVGLACLGASLI